MAKRPLGFVRPSMNPDLITMICTAGHVDHGKTSLVKLLTGCETDRLKVEKERGLTIEVGFAPCYLGDNLSCGIADVPGHEKFVRNMVAGVSGIDLAILVVAADDGIMPQTVEHCQIMELMGVRQGIVALTKIDLVSPERLTAAQEEVGRYIEGSFLAGAPICPLSSKSGDGFFDFYNQLVEKIRNVSRTRSQRIFRMPIDKVFVNTGVGTVITGIPVDGGIKIGDTAEIIPGGQTGRIRGIESFTRETETGGQGQCLALQIPELSKRPPKRGDALCQPGWVQASDTFYLQLQTVTGIDPPLRHTESVKFHSGRSEVSGKVFLLEKEKLPGGTNDFCVITLNQPVAAVAHDRFILRRPSPATTVAGGEILIVPQAGKRLKNREILTALREKAAFFGTTDIRSIQGRDRLVEWCLAHELAQGATPQEIANATYLVLGEAQTALQGLVTAERVLALENDIYIHQAGFDTCLGIMEDRIKLAAKDKKSLSLDLTELRKGLTWPQPVWQKIQAALAEKKVATFRDGKVVFKRAVAGLSAADQDLMERILQVYEDAGWQSPRPEELPEILREDPGRVRRIFEPLYHGGDLVRLTKNVVISYGHFKATQDEVVRIILENGLLDSSQFKHVIGSTRKYALAMLDYLDMRHITIRVQHNNRKLTSDYLKRLL